MRSASLLFFLLFSLSSFSQNSISKIEQPVPFKNDTLFGTLTLIGAKENLNGKGDLLTIFIAGSGPTDRDGNSAVAGGQNNSFLQLADSLAERGFASFRYDKLGIAKSKTDKQESEFRFDDNADAVAAIISKMKEIGFEKFVVMGHSEGSLVGMLAARQNPDLVGFVSLAGAARNAADVIKEQISKSPMGKEFKTSIYENLDSLKNGFMVKKYNPLMGSLFRESVQPYLISWMNYTPTEEIAKLEIPVLIVQGKEDLQVPAAAGEALDFHAKNSSLLLIPKMNHVLKIIENDEENKASYSEAGFPLSREMVEGVAGFLGRF